MIAIDDYNDMILSERRALGTPVEKHCSSSP